MTRLRMGAPVTAPQDAPERGTKPVPPTSGEGPETYLLGDRPGFLVRGSPVVYDGEDVTARGLWNELSDSSHG